MEDFRKDEIFYEEDFKTLDEPVSHQFEKPEDTEPPAPKEKKRRHNKHSFVSLISIQLVLCLIIIFVLFMLRSMDNDIYRQFKAFYDNMMSNTLVSQDSFDDIDLSSYLKASSDEV